MEQEILSEYPAREHRGCPWFAASLQSSVNLLSEIIPAKHKQQIEISAGAAG